MVAGSFAKIHEFHLNILSEPYLPTIVISFKFVIKDGSSDFAVTLQKFTIFTMLIHIRFE